jgi:pimeloyl-ACP methyl ester carboxylesterase
MQPLFEHRLDLAGYGTRVLELEGDGPPLLLLHGYADSADTWRLLLDRLGRAGRRAIAIDLPGFGAADPLADGPMLPQYDAVAAAALTYLEEPAVVVGNSLGGTTALRTAERLGPDRLAGTIAVAPAGLDMAPWFGIIESEPLLRALLAVPVPVPSRIVQETIGRVYRSLAFRDQGAVEAGVVRAFTSHHRDRAAVSRFLALGRRLLPELHGPFSLADIDGPLLVVWGERDRMVMATGAEKILSEVPHARLEVFEGCGHCPQLESADAFARLVLDWTGVLAPAGR